MRQGGFKTGLNGLLRKASLCPSRHQTLAGQNPGQGGSDCSLEGPASPCSWSGRCC